MNLSKLGLSAMLAAQHRLSTTGHNINNAQTEGYNRQSVLVSTAGATATSGGYVGRGVNVDTVQRAYDSFLYRQLVSAQSHGAALKSYNHEIDQVANLMADPSVGVTPALLKFFAGIQAVSSEPADPAARQELLGRSASLVTQINQADKFLQDQRNDINNQVGTQVHQINSTVERIHELNRQITKARASSTGGHEPNDLLDQRNQMVAELNQLIGVRTLEQNGTFSLMVGSGQVLLGGDTVFPLRAIPSESDPTRIVVAATTRSGGVETTIEMRESDLQGGSLGGLLQYRREALDKVQNDLGRFAVGLAMSFNAQHAQGEDLNGLVGTDYFSVSQPQVVSGASNTGGGDIDATYTDANGLTGSDYRFTYDAGDPGDPAAIPPELPVAPSYTITRLSDGDVTTWSRELSDPLDPFSPFLPFAALSLDGMNVTQVNGAADGDTFYLRPTRTAAADLSLAITDPARIAAAGASTGTANGDNALKLAQLQTDKTLGNSSMSLNEAFAQIVNQVGVLAQANDTAVKAQESLIAQNYAAQQAVSGVNLNEEYINLDRYLEQFRAASRMIDVSSAMFDTLLSLRN